AVLLLGPVGARLHVEAQEEVRGERRLGHRVKEADFGVRQKRAFQVRRLTFARRRNPRGIKRALQESLLLGREKIVHGLIVLRRHILVIGVQFALYFFIQLIGVFSRRS